MTMTSHGIAPPQTSIVASRRGPEDAMRETAVELEATFLAEMLKHAGFGEARSAFGGGVGEEQFASFLRDEQAKLMAQAGGIGLAETIFQAMKRGQ